MVVLASAGLLSEAREGGAQQALDLGIAFIGQIVADGGQGFGHEFIRRLGIEVGELSQADRGLAAGFGIFGVEALAVTGENLGGHLVVAALEKDFEELANITGRHAGGLAGKQNAFLAGIGNLSPEHAVENVGVGIDQDAGLGHLVFLHAQNLAERVHLPAHVLHHVVDGVDLDVAALVAVESEADGHALGGLHQHRCLVVVRIIVHRRFGGQTLEQLGEIDLGGFGSLGDLGLEVFRGSVGIMQRLAKMGEQANRLDDFLFLQRNDAAGPSSARRCSAGTYAAGNGDAGDAAEGRAAGRAGTSVACSLGGGDQLQQLLRIAEPLFGFGAQSLSRELGGHGNLAGGGIGGDELDFIDANGGTLVIAEGFLNLFGEVLGLGAAHGKGADQAGKVVERNLVGEQDAGEPGCGQQLCEAALGLSGFERDAVEKKLVVGNAEQKTGVAAFGQRLLEFVPGGLELVHGALMFHSIQPAVLDQNIEAVEERASGRAATGIGLGNVGDNRHLSVRLCCQ